MATGESCFRRCDLLQSRTIYASQDPPNPRLPLFSENESLVRPYEGFLQAFGKNPWRPQLNGPEAPPSAWEFEEERCGVICQQGDKRRPENVSQPFPLLEPQAIVSMETSEKLAAFQSDSHHVDVSCGMEGFPLHSLGVLVCPATDLVLKIMDEKKASDS